ncbi:hypothetical protein GOC57_01010 [Sinorhizobium meliloti]|nr:hypothetical protein [Sinorhizobium meliloti]MDW9491095.1 hypothetical protein [Sinorhizobium meliloti]MDW9559619.1 hypothetical protein [Sinorhizobium meliloti]MDW9646894.1 hypothetical protein [Sinorhizobium meliloti]MDW9857286.1 hypothetical protein [Sinorhizobium meliloti]
MRQPENGQGEICTVVHPSRETTETSMADVIRMQDRIVKRPRRRPVGKGGAKVLFFTGIRYERLDGRGPQPTAPAGRQAKKQ